MERIIIREVDNTFNVEALSSYDVAYVPGFGNSTTLFRTPTLVTSKYKFTDLFGSSAPTFDTDQSYPEATATTQGFPTYAIPEYKKLSIDSNPVMTVNESGQAVLDNTEGDGGQSDVSFFFGDYIDLQVEVGQPDWSPDENTNYFVRSDSDITTYMTYEVPSIDGITYTTYYEKYGESLYSSNINPSSLHYYESSDYPVLTSDTQIGVENGKIKKYYEALSSTPPMFKAGDYDPGYRYALYLLNLGMPVYYEQMNSNGQYTPINLKDDFTSALQKYGRLITTGSGEVMSISPYENGWCTYENGGYVVCTDESIEIIDDTSEGYNTDWFLGADISINSMYTGLMKRFNGEPEDPDYSFDSIGDYSIKYITTGGYPTFEYGLLSSTTDETQTTSLMIDETLSQAMLNLASKRGESLALIDHTDNPERSLYPDNKLSVINRVRERYADYDTSGGLNTGVGGSLLTFGAMFTPWYSCTHSAIIGTEVTAPNIYMPGSLAYLSALATQVKNNQTPWLAVSGVSRGKIPYFGSLHTNQPLTNNIADSYQVVPDSDEQDYALISINPITNIRQYGYCIWGNRTLKNNASGTKATSFLNIRNVVSDVKKRLFEASQQLLFEQNTEILWINFKSLLTPLLDTMISNNILSDYKLTKYNIDPDSGNPVPAYMVLAVVEIRPINSIEVFDLTVRIENNEIEVAEVE